MKYLKRFVNDIRSYLPYAIRSGKSDLKSQVAFSHLGWLWWILDPLLFMCVYTFVNVVVFGKSEKYLIPFIFVGYTSYQFFQTTIKGSVRLVFDNKGIVKNVYMPKPVLMLTKTYVDLFKFGVSFTLVFISMLIYRVPPTYQMVFFFPLLFLLIVLSFAIGTIMMHFGVFVQDLSNVINVLLRLVFYLSGVFYSLDKRIKNETIRFFMLKCNPIAFIMYQMRESLLYGGKFHYRVYFAWLIVAFALLIVGLRLIYKNENGYVKVI